MSEQPCPDCGQLISLHFDAAGQFRGCPVEVLQSGRGEPAPVRVMIRRWGYSGRHIDIGGVAPNALIAVVDEMRDGMVRVIDLDTDADYWVPLRIATREGSRRVSSAEAAEGLERARLLLGKVTLSRSLRGCGERALTKGTDEMKNDTPQSVIDATTPPVEVPALTVTWHFLGGTTHTITAPVDAFETLPIDTDRTTAVRIETNGLITAINMAHVLYVEQRETVIKQKPKKEQGK